MRGSEGKKEGELARGAERMGGLGKGVEETEGERLGV